MLLDACGALEKHGGVLCVVVVGVLRQSSTCVFCVAGAAVVRPVC